MIGPWDVFTLLNGAYRIHEGQSPSTDFSNPIGPLVYGLVAIGMHLSLSLRAVTYSQVIFLVIEKPRWQGLVSFRLGCPPRTRPGLTSLRGLAFGVRPAARASHHRSLTYAMLYNTDAWVLDASAAAARAAAAARPPRSTAGSRRDSCI